MAKQNFVWTCLPNGLTEDGRGLRVSVLLSPRLDAEGDPQELSSFREWLDWPATLAEATFLFYVDGALVGKSAVGEAGGASQHDPSVGTPDSAVWQALFRKDLYVEGYQLNTDVLDSEVLSYSATDIHDLVKDLYADLARNSGTELPTIKTDLLGNPAWAGLIDAVGQVDHWGNKEQRSDVLPLNREGPSQIERRFAGLSSLVRNSRAGTARGSESEKVRHLARFDLFHTPPLRPKPLAPSLRNDGSGISSVSQEFVRPPEPTAEELVKSMHFHRVVAAMNGYPTLQRCLGLVVDFVLERRVIPENPDFMLRVAVEFPALPTSKGKPDLTPITRASHIDGTFFAHSRPNQAMRIERGLLDLYSHPDQYAVLQADVDGAGLKLMNFARTLGGYRKGAETDAALLADDVSRKDKAAGAPALRTAGMMLVRKDRALALKQRFDANQQQKQQADTSGTTELWAEDLVRGYRIDAWDAQTGRWRSLCRRTAEYKLAGGQILVQPASGEEEATVQLAATKSPDPDYNKKVLYLHEALVSWTGWSLGAPPPGKAVGVDVGTPPGAKPEFTEEAGELAGLDFRSRFRALPGSLPRLRYGRRYALRARAVDLAGNSLPPTEKDFGPEQPENAAQAFLRFEPLAAPVLALAQPAGGATALPQEGESMYRLALRSFNDVFDAPTPAAPSAPRYAVPPQATVREAELHGELDQAGVLSPATFQMLAHDKDRDAHDPAAALVEEKVPMKGPLDENTVDTTFAVWREGRAMSYLPDPMAVAVSAWFIGHPAMPATETLHIPLYPDGLRWPEAQPFRIELFEDPADPLAKPFYDAAAHVLRIPLAKGERATLRLAMRLCKRDLFERMGLWQWLDTATQQQIAEAALDGRCWLFTPWQEVALVHAVQRPLILPAIRRLDVARFDGETQARPRFLADCSLKSTDRLDLLASWHEPADDPNKADPTNGERNDLAFQVKVTDADDYVAGHDAYPEHTLPADENAGPDVIGINSRKRDLVAVKRHEFNDTRYRRIEYRLKATTRYREYLPPSLLLEPDPETAPGPYQRVEKNLTVEGPSAVTWIPNSAPPPQPQVLYVVPTFGWVRSQDEAGTARSWRRGGGLRVYLNRPWNVTGYGEMLAVVLPPAGFAGDPDSEPKAMPYKKFVTQWGNDPIWESPFVAGIAPARSHFPLARWQPDPAGGWLPPGALLAEADQQPGPFNVHNLKPPSGDASVRVEIAPHDVFYDQDRQLWYCDIEIDQGQSYWPFVRLALARYQPCSTSGAHLSEIVLADFMQLTADRWLTVRTEREGEVRQVTVYGQGYSDSAEAGSARSQINWFTGEATGYPALSSTSVVEVWLEQLDLALGEDFGWRRVASGVPTAAAPGAGPHLSSHPALLFAQPSPELNLHAARMFAARDFNALQISGLAEKLVLRPPLWDGRVELPTLLAEDARLRLVVAEYEEYLIDPEPGVADVNQPDGVTELRVGRRLVFVEHLEIVS
jgi:hypothetical protein